MMKASVGHADLGYLRSRLEVQRRNLGWVEAPGHMIVWEKRQRREQDRAGGI